LRRIVALYIPVVVSLIVSQLGIVIDRNLASRVGEQTIAWMADATRLREFPLGLVSTAVSMAVLPALSRLNVRSAGAEFKKTLGLGLRLVVVLIVPAVVGLGILGVPIISLIFQHGEFTPFDTQQTAHALAWYLAGTPFAAVDLLLIFAFYAQKDTVTPVIVGIVCVLIYVITAPLLAFGLGLGMVGLVMSNSIQLASHATITFVLLHRRLGSLASERLLPAMAKIALSSAVMALCVYLSLLTLRTWMPGQGPAARAITVAGAGGVGLVVYLVWVLWLGVDEARLLLGLFARGRQPR
jgi:putative peptidoglycan lipid II flippase